MRPLASTLAALAAAFLPACFSPVGPEEPDGGPSGPDADAWTAGAEDARVGSDAAIADAAAAEDAARPDAAVPADAALAADAGRCGDPDKLARFQECSQSADEASCKAAGGAWSTGPFGEIFCDCPTGQGGCPCSSAEDCLGWCQVDDSNGCPEEGVGSCTARSALFGCVCVYYPHTELGLVCID